MLKNLFKKSNTTSIYIGTSEVHLNGDTTCNNFIATYITTEAIFKNLYVGIELIFTDGILTKAYDHEFGEKKVRPIAEDEIGFPLPTYPPNLLWQLVEDPNGPHQMGGETPSDFQLPPTDGIMPFQYLGYINNTDPTFNWLPFKVHLTCPIFLNIESVYLDYSDPLKPIVINKEEVDAFVSNYDNDLNKDTVIVFNELKFKSISSEERGYNIGNAGLSPTIQYTEIPICPKSGNRMLLLAQFLNGSTTKHHNIPMNEDYYEACFGTMNFWGDGDMYVYFEPTYKTVCYMIQNT